jgi:HD-like signal output (HDOD) protein
MNTQLKNWLKKAEQQPVPVLAHSIETLATLTRQDELPMAELVEAVEQDPGLTVQVLRMCNARGRRGLSTEVSSVQQALMLLGTQQLSRLPHSLPSVDRIETQAREQLLRTFCRAYHAAAQATEWANWRRDMVPDEVFAATLLHFLGEMMLAHYAPEKLLEIFALRREKHIASEEAQYLVLGFTLDQLSLAIARQWSLPTLVQEALQPENAQHPRAYGIMLAVQLARGAAIDWYNDKTRKIQEQAAEWLDMPLDDVIRASHKTAVRVARLTSYYNVLQSAALLIAGHRTTNTVTQPDAVTDDAAAICLTPQINQLKEALAELQAAVNNGQPLETLMHIGLQGMHDGIGLNRVVFAKLDRDNNALVGRVIIGAENDPLFNRFHIRLDRPHLFSRLMDKTQAVCINDDNRKKYWPMVPTEFQKLVGTNSFMAMSLVIGQKPVGLFYADRHNHACQIDSKSYDYFKKLCTTLSQVFNQAKAA